MTTGACFTAEFPLIKETKSCLDSNEFRYLCGTSEGREGRRDIEADGEYSGAPVR